MLVTGLGFYAGFAPLVHLLLVQGRSAHDFARITEALLLLSVSLLCLWGWPRKSVRVGLFTALTWSVTSGLYSVQPGTAMRELALLLGLVVLAASVSRLAEEMRSRLLMWLQAGLLVYGAIFLLSLAMVLLSEGQVQSQELVFGYDNPRFLNHVQTVGLPLALAVSLSATRKDLRWMGLATAFLCAFIATFLVARATLLATVVATVAVGLAMGRQARPYVGRAAVTIGMGGVLGLLTLKWFGVSVMEAVGNTASANARLLLWRYALDDAAQSWLGVGPMHFSRVPRGDAAHPHNFYLQTAAELGWPAALALLAAVLYGLWCLLRRLRARREQEAQAWGPGLVAACIAIAVDAGLSGNLVMPLPQVWVAIAVGLACAWYKADTPSEVPARRRVSVGHLAVAAIMAVHLGVAWMEYRQPSPHLSASRWINKVEGQEMRPRYWLHGWF
ncbi:O-antigen ligase family protein [Pelomonas sp. CA6]|uniref:O-antigen ligase family protein n=1 Tax=Pelomonas sp. CA6 TaxID=2907999 RepID=UPI001F4C2422|nr:O-antigen ligase family protein [Pelomonas sp. CA6]MCH7343617.1 O-antigen ligase family protein [Pelomonas sp. CA6]